MTYHYTYRITNLITKMHYYGDRTSIVKPSDDLGKVYFSSYTNKFFKVDQILNPSHYKYKIIKTFDTRVEAKELEKKFHMKFDVKNNPNFINRQNQNCIYFDTSEKVTVIDKHGKTFQTSIYNEKYLSGELKGVASGLVACIDILTNSHCMVTKKEFKTDSNLVSVTASKILINIYDNNDKLMFSTDRNFKKVCLLNNLPYQGLIKSYKNNTKLFETEKAKNNAARYNNEKYIGWYVKLIEL